MILIVEEELVIAPNFKLHYNDLYTITNNEVPAS